MLHNRYAAYSGEEAAVDRLAALLERHGHEVRRYERDSATLKTPLARVGALFASLFGWRARREIGCLLRDFEPHIVHLHNLYPLISPAVLPMIAARGVPLVMSLHNYRLICPTGLFYSHGEICERCDGGREWACALRNCTGQRGKSLAYALRNVWARKRGYYRHHIDRFLCLTDFQRRRLGDGSARFVVLPNSARASADPVPVGDYVGYVGRISEEKGAVLLAEACAHLPEVPFVFAGACERRCAHLFKGLDNVTLLGPLAAERMPAFYRGARFLLFPSRCYEGFPMVLLEAMAESRATVAAAIGGVPEIVADGTSGLLFEPDDGDRFIACIDSLWHDRARCERLGRGARERLTRHFDEDSVYRRLITVYTDAARHAGGGMPA